MELILVGLVCASLGACTTYLIGKVRDGVATKFLTAGPNCNINPYVQEIISLTLIDPKGWTFDHGNDKSLPHWWYKKESDDSIGISVESNYKNIRRIWSPSVVELSVAEKRDLKEAFNNMQAQKISKSTFAKLLTT